ncbi:MAG TPA: tripartite tricarboxylate transporter substrate binding protein [Burkholderiaceae bacterium]|nr:tripartite tricarboxylate transporter substrate binding protein [Burkholderiaceae bacterium]
MMRRLLTFAASMLIAGAALAQSYPEKPIRIIVPFPPGGGADVVTRIMQPKLTEELGHPVIIDNRAGAGGNIGTDAAARSAADGYTFLVATVAQAINHTLTSPTWSLTKDFTPVAVMILNQSLLAAHPSVPASNVRELIELAKAKPGQVKYASFGYGSSAHMMAELFQIMTGVQMLHVPYKGAAPAVNDVVGGQVDIIFSDIAAILPHTKAGRVKPIAVASAAPFDGLPGVPTVGQTVSGFDAGGFLAILAPAGTPKVAIDKVNAAVNKALQVPEIREKLEGLAGIPKGGSPDQAAQFVQSEVDKWARVIKTANIKPN